MTNNTARGSAICRSILEDGRLVETLYDYVTVCRGLENKVVNIEVVEECDTRQHKPVVLKVMLGKVQKQIRAWKVPSGGELPGGKEATQDRVLNHWQVKGTLGKERLGSVSAKKRSIKNVMSNASRVERVNCHFRDSQIERADEMDSCKKLLGKQMKERGSFQEDEKESKVAHLQAMPAVVASLSRSRWSSDMQQEQYSKKEVWQEIYKMLRWKSGTIRTLTEHGNVLRFRGASTGKQRPE